MTGEPPVRTGLIRAMARGFLGRCPHCGEGKVFGRFLKVRPTCEACGLELHHHRADDLPPYVVIFVVAHVVGYLILETESAYEVPLWVEIGVWPLFTLVLALALLQPVKGAVVGLQYALGMHGFAALPRGRPAPGPEDTRRESPLAPAGVERLDRA
ncbi:DUF983 domain-containing protein [Methylobacterium sp. NEAU 140]|uniref:DUF983 domain-containing protein n=1 Tax=Methylobacterium sp. NEAU 140 TaxID=3064945 RepID=UPI002734C608|nr:DUF983 domain-containing protein [Methylobacterium sp. NEAU 140]MDP4021358.1 DUF983 domain-containing protein [Methylobacterium sp. NEAU 140]